MFRYITDGGYRDPLVTPEYQEQLDDLSDTLAVGGLHRVNLMSVENALYKAVDTGHIEPREVQQTLEDYGLSFGESV